MAYEENPLKKIYTTWGKVSEFEVDLFQFKDIMTAIFFSFPFSSEISMEYLVSNQTDLPRIIKDTISQKWETIFWVPT